MDQYGISVLQRVATETMLAGVLHGSRDIRMEEVRRPQPGVGQLLLRVHRAGICGSDIHYFVHGYCGRFVPTRPFILGHEFVATVDAVGGGFQSPVVGDRVVVNPAASCGHCEACRSGRGNLCGRVVMLGSASTTPPTDGAFAQYVVVPAHQCYTLPENMSDSDAAMMEPLSVALHAIHRAGGVAGSRILISGGGPIGLLTARAARALGAALVVVSEPNEIRRRLAAELAGDDVLDPTCNEFVKTAVALSEGGFDVVFEASGATAAVRNSLDVVRRGGAIVQIGTVGVNDVVLPVNDLMVREISLLGSFRYADEFPNAIRLAVNGRIGFDGLITATIPFTDLASALTTASSSAESLKIHVTVE
jgi:L-idonate 5-dehydrogenase